MIGALAQKAAEPSFSSTTSRQGLNLQLTHLLEDQSNHLAINKGVTNPFPGIFLKLHLVFSIFVLK